MENLVRKTTSADRKLASAIIAEIEKAGKNGSASLAIGKRSKVVKLSAGVVKLLTQIFSLMTNNKSIAVLAAETEVTTQEAAELLNFSRPYVVKLLEEGKIPFKKVGSHRRMLLRDVLFYRQKFRKQRKKALAFLVQQAQDLKLGYQ